MNKKQMNSLNSYVILIICICITNPSSWAQDTNLEWVKTYGSNHTLTPIESALSVRVDNLGNVYTLGAFNNTIDFNPGVGTAYLSTTGQYDREYYLQKLDSNGDFVWVKHIEIDNEFAAAGNFIIDSNGDLIIIIHFPQYLDADPSANVYTIGSGQGQQLGIIKLDANGGFMFAKAISSTDNSAQLNSVAANNEETFTIDSNNNIYLTGYFKKTVDFDPGASSYELTSYYDAINDIYYTNSFILKLDTNGNFIQANHFSAPTDNFISSLLINSIDELFVFGRFNESIDLDLSPTVYELTETGGNSDLFMLKTDSNFNFIYAKKIGSDGIFEEVSSTVLDGDGNIIIGGMFQGGDFDADPGIGLHTLSALGDDDGFIIKLTNSGDFVWATAFAGTGRDVIRSLALDSQNNVYSTGFYRSTSIDFDASANTDIHTLSSTFTMFFNKMNADGTYGWTKTISDNYTASNCLTINNNDDLFLVLMYDNTIDADFDTGTTNISSIGSKDIAIMKMTFPSLGIDDVEKYNAFKLYPNPMQDSFSIDFKKVKKNVKIKILDVLSKSIYEKAFFNTDKIKILNNLESGVYFIEISMGQKRIIKKIIKE